MEKPEIEKRLQEILLPVFGLTSTEEIPAGASLVNDIGADSLDFVEITYLIEREYGITLKPGELVSGASYADGAGNAGSNKIETEDFFIEGRLTASGAQILKEHFNDGDNRFSEGMTKIDLFRSISVSDLAETIWRYMQNGEKSC